MSTSQVLQHLYSLEISSQDLSRYLYCLIQRDEEEQYLISLQGSELVRLVEFLDEALCAIPATDDVFRQCLHKLQAICGHRMIIPSSHNISGDLARVGDYPISVDGGTSDVWKGVHDGKNVCIKCPRVSEEDLQAITQSFLKEAVVWKRLRHPNVVPFIGVTTKPLQFVSEFMPNGTLTKYVKKNPSADRVGLLLDVAEGLDYLHANYTVHGDLKGPNILIDHNGNARLTDFGLASVVRGLNSVLVTQVKGYTEAWAAPEVLEKGDKATPAADIFAFGMVVIEVFTGMYPFSGFTTSVIVTMIMDGKRPARPQEAQELGLTDSVWDMALKCWRQDPAHRPTVTEVVRLIRGCYKLRTANLPLSTNGQPTPTRLQETPQRSESTSFRSYKTSAASSSALNSSRQVPPLQSDDVDQGHMNGIGTVVDKSVYQHPTTVPGSIHDGGSARSEEEYDDEEDDEYRYPQPGVSTRARADNHTVGARNALPGRGFLKEMLSKLRLKTGSGSAGRKAQGYSPPMSDGYYPSDPSKWTIPLSDSGYEPQVFHNPLPGDQSSYSGWRATNPFQPGVKTGSGSVGRRARAYNPPVSNGGYGSLKPYHPEDPSTWPSPLSGSGYEPPVLYNPSDPSTFPTPLSGADSSYSGWRATNPQRGQYSGMPDI